MDDVSEALGQLRAQVKSLEQKVVTLQTGFDDMHDMLTQAKGGWKILIGFGFIGIMLGAGLGKAVETMIGLFK